MDMTAHQAELATCKRNIQLLVAALGSPSDSFSISLPYIQKLDNLTEKEFRALEQAATDKNDKYYFALSYNSLTLTGVIHWKPHPITGNLKNSFDHAVRESLKKLQPNVRNDCLWEGYRTSCKIYRGKYKGSRNASSFKWTYGFHQTAFLEVGFTAQSYAQLVDDAQMWLEGEKALQTIFLVQVEEDPEYTKSSMCNFSEEEIRYSLSLGDVNNPMAVPTDPSNPFGPIQINGSVWVGETKIFLEVWKRGDAGARRRGPRYNLVPEKPSDEHDITMNDMFALDDPSGGDEKLLLDWDALRESLEEGRRGLAIERFWEAHFHHLENPDE